MNTRLQNILATATLLLTAGCVAHGDDSEFDCSKTLCGCPKESTVNLTMRFSDAEGKPLPGASLICHDDGDLLGTTSPDGLLRLLVVGKATPGCGFVPRCQVAYLKKKDQSWGRPFWFARFIRGEDVVNGGDSVQRISDDSTDPD